LGRSGVGTLRGHSLHQHRDAVGPSGRATALGRVARAVLLSFKSALSLRVVVLAALAFLVGRATVLQTMSPFGLALFAATLGMGPPRVRAVITGAATALGILSAGVTASCLEFIGAAVGLAVFTAAFERQGKAGSPATVAALAFTVTALAGSTRAFLFDPTPYQFLMAFFSALLAFILTLVYSSALPPLVHPRRLRTVGPEEIIAGAIAAATALAGLSGLAWGGLKPAGVVTGLLVLTAAFTGGGGVGAVVGTVAGVVSTLCGAGGLSLVALEAFSGLTAGSFRDFGKKGSAVGYFFGLLVLTPLVEQVGLLRSLILEGALAVVGFLVVPTALLAALRAALEGAGAVETDALPGPSSREHMGRRLIDFSHVFGQLAVTLKQLSATAPAPASSAGEGKAVPVAVSPPLESLADAACRVCQACRLFRSCWKDDLDRTRGAMAGLLEVTVKRGQLEARDVPAHIRRRCIHLGELITTMNFLHEISALNRHWRKKLEESRSVVSQQLDGLSTILRSLGEGLSEEADGDRFLAGEIARRLRRNGFPAHSVRVSCVPDGKPELSVTADPCQTGDACRQIARPQASAVVGRSLAVADVRCERTGTGAGCAFRLVVPRQLDFRIGVAQARKSPGGISGDTYLIRELPGSRLAAVLSDGTGVGPRAAAESQSTVKMLEELFKLGFDTEMTVKTVNSMLLLRSAHERFATLDLLTVDLFDGQARFIKVGASPSYLRRGGEVSVIHSSNLPLGVLPEISTEGRLHMFRPGDLVVLATDGLTVVSDRNPGSGPREGWVAEFLREVGDAGSQEVADALVEAAVSMSRRRLGAVAGAGPGGSAYQGLRDDVTVVALRFGPCEGV